MSESRENRLADYADDARRARALESMSGTEIQVEETGPDIVPDLPAAEGIRHPREDVMARIAANAEAQRQKEMELAGIYDADAREAGLTHPAEEPEPTESEPARSPAAQQPVPQVAVPAAAAPSAAPVPRTITIEGRQYAITPEQEEQLLRVGMATNFALHQYQQQPQPAPEPARPIVDPDAIREAVKKIQYGGEDDAAAALTDLVSGIVSRVPQGPQFDSSDIINRAVQASQAQAQLVADAAIIRNEYQDIFAHPQREFLAKVNVDAIKTRDASLGVRRPDLEIYREAGDMVREAMNLPRPGSSDQPTALQAASNNVVPRNDVIERKRAAPRATQAIGLRAPAPAPARPPSKSEIVNQMRQSRGQPSLM